MSDSFYQMLGVVLPVIVIQIFQYLSARKNAAKSEADRQEIKAQLGEVAANVQENTEITQAIKISKDDMDAQGVGRERIGFIEGQRRASDFGPLSTNTIDITKG